MTLSSSTEISHINYDFNINNLETLKESSSSEEDIAKFDNKKIDDIIINNIGQTEIVKATKQEETHPVKALFKSVVSKLWFGIKVTFKVIFFIGKAIAKLFMWTCQLVGKLCSGIAKVGGKLREVGAKCCSFVMKILGRVGKCFGVVGKCLAGVGKLLGKAVVVCFKHPFIPLALAVGVGIMLAMPSILSIISGVGSILKGVGGALATVVNVVTFIPRLIVG